jgi:hypothetical protein
MIFATRMKNRPYYIFLIIIVSLASCRGEIKDDRVKKEAERSLEIALDYIKTQRELHEFDLNRKIRIVNDNIKKAQDQNRQLVPDHDSNLLIASLQKEKAGLEQKLKVLKDNTDASTKRITEKWGRYNQSLDAMLKNMQDYLKGIPIDKDTLK